MFPSVCILVAILSTESMVGGFHVYMGLWPPLVGDEFELEIEELDRYAVAIKVNGDIAGRAFYFFKVVLGHLEATVFEL